MQIGWQSHVTRCCWLRTAAGRNKTFKRPRYYSRSTYQCEKKTNASSWSQVTCSPPTLDNSRACSEAKQSHRWLNSQTCTHLSPFENSTSLGAPSSRTAGGSETQQGRQAQHTVPKSSSPPSSLGTGHTPHSPVACSRLALSCDCWR